MTPAEIAQNLDSEDPEARRLATIALGTVVDAGEVTPLLMRALGDGNWRVREEAVRVGGHLVDRVRLFPVLISAICQGDNVGLRNAAISLFGQAGEAAMPVLERALGEVQQEHQKFVIEAVAVAGGAHAADVLVDCLRSPDPNTIAASIDALAVVGGPKAEATLLEVLRCDDAFQRMAALVALNRIEAEIPWEVFPSLLNDRLVWRVALPALGRCREPEAVDPLLRSLAESSERMLADAAAAIARLSQRVPQVLSSIEESLWALSGRQRDRFAALLGHCDLYVRQGATLLLACARDALAVEGMLTLMREQVLPEPLRLAAERWGADIIELLLDRQVRPAAGDRAAALMLASELLTPQRGAATPEKWPPVLARLLAELRRCLYGRDPELRLAAAKAISPFAERADAVPLVEAAIGGDRDLSDACGPVLLALADREPDAVREAIMSVELSSCAQEFIAELVAMLDPGRALPRLHGALLADDPGVRCAALAGLSILGGEEALSLIALALRDQNPAVHLRSVEVLGAVRGPEGAATGLPVLQQALSDDRPEFRAAVARALGATEAPQAADALHGLLSEPDAGVQVAALRALQRLHAKGIENAFVNALRHRDAEVVKVALEGIYEVNAESARPCVVAALGHPGWDVRHLAVQLLARYADDGALAALGRALATESDPMVRAEIEGCLRGARQVP